VQLEVFKCYYKENHIFLIKAILKHRQVICTRNKMLFTTTKYLFYEERYLSQYILFRKTLLEVLHNMSLTFLLPWQHTGFQTSPILKTFLVTLNFPY